MFSLYNSNDRAYDIKQTEKFRKLKKFNKLIFLDISPKWPYCQAKRWRKVRSTDMNVSSPTEIKPQN